MKSLMTSIQALVSLLLAAAAMTACSNDDMIADEPTPVTTETPRAYTITVNATKGEATRALTLDGNTLNATWKAVEEVKVYSVTGEGSTEMESITPIGTLTAQSNGTAATLKGEFDSIYTPTTGAKLRLKFLSDKYTGQKATLEYIASNCDFATADVTITGVTDGNVTTTAASFENQQAIVKFTLKKLDGSTPVAATSLTVKVGGIIYDVSSDNPTSEIFVAMPAASNRDVTLTATSSDGNFSCEKTGITFEKGRVHRERRHPPRWNDHASKPRFGAMFEKRRWWCGLETRWNARYYGHDFRTLRRRYRRSEAHKQCQRLCQYEIPGGEDRCGSGLSRSLSGMELLIAACSIVHHGLVLA